MERAKIPGLASLEVALHRRSSKVPLSSEIRDCFDYFDKHTPNVLGKTHLILIHNNDLTLRRVLEGKDYSVETRGLVRVVGVDSIPKAEQQEIVNEIRNITFPYADYVKNKRG